MVLISYCPLDGDAKDVRGSNDGATNGTTFNNGILGEQAGQFSANDNDYIDLGAGSISPPWTACAWFNLADNGESNTAFLDFGENYSIRYEQFENTEKYAVTEYGVDDYTFSKSSIWNEWTFVVWLGTSSSTELYVNGQHSGSIGTSINCPLQEIGQGDSSSDGSPDGKIQNIRVYNHNLTKQEIQYLYQVGKRGLHTSNKRSL